jgi:hypothetical protein
MPTQETKHTPLPWSVDGYDIWHHGIDYRDEADPHLYTGISINEKLRHSPIAAANLALIVEAVNRHAALIAAATEARDFLLKESIGMGDLKPTREDVLAALQAALPKPLTEEGR